MMKKIVNIFIILAAASLVIPSCAKLEKDAKENDGFAITFENINVDSKSMIDGVDKLQSFAVWGAVKNHTSSTYQNLFEDTEVRKTATGWEYDNDKYWEASSTYRFFAYTPVTEHSAVFNSGTMTYSLDYELVDKFNIDDSEFTDLLVASNSVETSSAIQNNPSAVEFTFSHPFVKLNLHIYKSSDNEDEKMVVNSVQLSGVKLSGKYNYFINTGISEWSLNSTESNIKIEPKQEIGNENDDSAWIKLQFYALPQYVSAGQMNVTVTYDYYDNGVKTEKTFSSAIPQTDIWRANKVITYKAELSEEHKIRFQSPSVENWGEQGAGIVIIQ